MLIDPASTDRRAPLVSVCIPAYKAERYLEPTLRSIADQTLGDWEVIVTEDGSRDRAEEIVRRFAASVPQGVLYHRHEVNRGLPATRNTGIAAAAGTWIAFLDSDDLWKPPHLELLVAAADAVRADVAFSGTEWFEDGTERIVQQSVPTEQDLQELPAALFLGRLSVLPSSAMVRRQALLSHGAVNLEYPHVNDTELWLRLLRAGGRMAYSNASTCLYRKHPGAMSKRAAELLLDSAALCEAFASWAAIPAAIKRSRPADLYRWAGMTLLPYDAPQAVTAFRRALRLQPTRVALLALLAKAVLKARGQTAPLLRGHRT